MTKYSQHEIEKYLDKQFSSSGLPAQAGFFLEIGAWDGELISQTAWLEREKGWTGLCVDPFPVHFGKRTCRVCAKAVSKDGAPRAFIKVTIDRNNGGDVSYFSGFKDTIQTHWPMIAESCDYEELEVETITIARLYEQYSLPQHIEFLSVDTEGSELEIFQSIDFSKHSFGLIVFEHNENLCVKNGVGEILQGHGYQLLDSLRCDDIYVRKDAK